MKSFNSLPFESEEEINYFAEEIESPITDENKTSEWIQSAIQSEGHQLSALNFIFCSDQYLHQINLEYLNHDTFTDVITFPYSETQIEGDVYISVDRIRENASTFKMPFEKELYRVIIHGVLHLMGYGDKNPTDKKQMTLKENQYLRKLTFPNIGAK